MNSVFFPPMYSTRVSHSPLLKIISRDSTRRCFEGDGGKEIKQMGLQITLSILNSNSSVFIHFIWSFWESKLYFKQLVCGNGGLKNSYLIYSFFLVCAYQRQFFLKNVSKISFCQPLRSVMISVTQGYLHYKNINTLLI